jgi:hypothetical protein
MAKVWKLDKGSGGVFERSRGMRPSIFVDIRYPVSWGQSRRRRRSTFRPFALNSLDYFFVLKRTKTALDLKI